MGRRIILHNYLGGAYDEAAFSEAKHPRGNPQNAGQFTSKGGGGAAKKAEEAPRAKVKTERGGTGVTKAERGPWKGNSTNLKESFTCCKNEPEAQQPVDSLDELYSMSKEAESTFKNDMKEIAGGTKGSISYTPEEYAEPGTILKKKSSAERKIKNELHGDFRDLKDVVRATVLHTDWRDTRKAAADFIQSKQDQIVRVKDRVAEPLGAGYKDILINYRLPNGIVAEVQFNTPAMTEVKNGIGHKLYEQQRDLAAAGDMAGVTKLDEQMVLVYQQADTQSGNGKWKH